MAERSKELLEFEHKGMPLSSLESTLLVCDNERTSKTKTNRDDGSHMTAPVPPSQLNQKSEMRCLRELLTDISKKLSHVFLDDDHSVLGKVKDFLGTMSEANKRLELDAKDHPENYDIEELTGNESKVIEMDLMLGVADLHTPEAVAAAELAISNGQPVISLAADGSETDSDECSSDDDNGNDEIESDNDAECDGGNDGEKPSSHVKKSICGEDYIHEKQKVKPHSKKRSRIVELS